MAAAVALLCAPAASGGEGDLYAQMMRRYERVNDELYKALSDVDDPYLPEYPDRILSLRKNATVTIGGEVRATYAYSDAQWKNPTLGQHLPAAEKFLPDKAESRAGDLSLTTTKLLIDARVGDRWRVFFDLDLDGYHGYRGVNRRAVNLTRPGGPVRGYAYEYQRDYLNQAYVELMKAGHSGFGLMVGKMRMPFGLWNRPNLFAQSFMDAPDLTGSYLMTADNRSDAAVLPHASRLVDPVMAALVSYEMRDIVRFEAALFQENELEYDDYNRSGGISRYRSLSHAPQSWQLGVSLLPLEGWELTAHFRNRHRRDRGIGSWVNSPYRWDFRGNLATGGGDPTWNGTQWTDAPGDVAFGSRSNEQSFIVGVAVEFSTKLSMRTEYAHGWNQGFNKYINSDGVNLGFSYRLTPLLTLHAQGEWLHVKDRSWMGSDATTQWLRDTRNNRLYRGMLGLEYELASGLTLEAGWQYEYWKVTSSLGGLGGRHARQVNTANMFYVGSRFIF